MNTEKSSVTSVLEVKEESDISGGVPVCGGNLSSTVVDTTEFLDEITYTVGGRKYIENAD